MRPARNAFHLFINFRIILFYFWLEKVIWYFNEYVDGSSKVFIQTVFQHGMHFRQLVLHQLSVRITAIVSWPRYWYAYPTIQFIPLTILYFLNAQFWFIFIFYAFIFIFIFHIILKIIITLCINILHHYYYLFSKTAFII